MHGAGNDFIVTAFTNTLDLDARVIIELADRYTGIGFDQWLIISPPNRLDADFLYTIYNHDGSQAKNCGNGARCIADFVYQFALSNKPKLTFDLADELLYVSRKDTRLSVQFTLPKLQNKAIKVTTPWGDFSMCVLTTNNPHAIIYIGTAIDNFPLNALKTHLQKYYADSIGEDINLGIFTKLQHGIALRTHERGVGETRACGTNAVACAWVYLQHHANNQVAAISVVVKGGTLEVEVTEDRIYLIGPTATVYTGTVDISIPCNIKQLAP